MFMMASRRPAGTPLKRWMFLKTASGGPFLAPGNGSANFLHVVVTPGDDLVRRELGSNGRDKGEENQRRKFLHGLGG